MLPLGLHLGGTNFWNPGACGNNSREVVDADQMTPRGRSPPEERTLIRAIETQKTMKAGRIQTDPPKIQNRPDPGRPSGETAPSVGDNLTNETTVVRGEYYSYTGVASLSQAKHEDFLKEILKQIARASAHQI